MTTLVRELNAQSIGSTCGFTPTGPAVAAPFDVYPLCCCYFEFLFHLHFMHFDNPHLRFVHPFVVATGGGSEASAEA